jgi:hypothetical protein
MKNKAQLETLQSIIIAIVFIGIIIGIGFLILDEFKNTTDLNNVAIVKNETINSVTSVGKYVVRNSTTAEIKCYNTFVPIVVRGINASGSTVITAENYSYNTDTGKIWSTTSGLYNNTNWNVTYTYQSGKDDCGAIVDTINVIKKVPTWLSIIVILAIVGILLAIVFSVLPKAGVGGSSFGRGSGGTIAEI